MMTMQEMSKLATQGMDMKECREVYANNETQEKFDEIQEEVSLLYQNLKQLSKEIKELKEQAGAELCQGQIKLGQPQPANSLSLPFKIFQ